MHFSAVKRKKKVRFGSFLRDSYAIKGYFKCGRKPIILENLTRDDRQKKRRANRATPQRDSGVTKSVNVNRMREGKG